MASDLDLPPPAPLLLQGPPPSSSSTRRFPPPCWSNDETTALIESYRDKWYSLHRGNLRANHWQDVALSVSARCPSVSPPKTPIQCRHKMEKLRKRYRSELQRARSVPVSLFTSSWAHFKLMDSLEKGYSIDAHHSDSPDDDDNDEENEHDQPAYGNANTRSVHNLYDKGIGIDNEGGSGNAGGFRIRIPTGVSIAQPGSEFYPKVDQKLNPNPNPYFGGRLLIRDDNIVKGSVGKREREVENYKDPMGEMAAAIHVLGDGFVKMEQTKMEMAREIETARMEMEMKRTEMILKSQERIVEAFVNAISEKKKSKRVTSSEC